jgi:hypothetical protein
MGSRRRLRARVEAQGTHEVRQFAMVLDASEARGGAEQAEAGPAVNHVARAPALHIARDVAKRGDEILDAVCGREEATQGRWQLELEHREGFFQPVPETGRGVRVTVDLELGRQGLAWRRTATALGARYARRKAARTKGCQEP